MVMIPPFLNTPFFMSKINVFQRSNNKSCSNSRWNLRLGFIKFKMNLKIQTQNSLICHSTQVTVEACVHLVLCFMTTIGIFGVEEINEQEK